MEAAKAHNKNRTIALQIMKSALQKALLAPGANYAEEIEQQILIKLKSDYEKSIAEFKKANREDLVQEDSEQLEIIKEFLPKEPTKEELVDYVLKLKKDNPAINIGSAMKEMKAKFPIVSGMIISVIVKENL
ncbi:MAG: GatB/YqeY domain-containing protein [archaeon]|nr:GatB/YqeY domain-containing protein [archaeon]